MNLFADNSKYENHYRSSFAGRAADSSRPACSARQKSFRCGSKIWSNDSSRSPLGESVQPGRQESAEIQRQERCSKPTDRTAATRAFERTAERRPSTRLFERSVDAAANRQNLQKEVWRFVPFQPHRQAFESLGLELSETDGPGHRTQRTEGQALAQRRLAPHQKKARRCRRSLVFLDESGFSLHPTRVRSWAPGGKTPVLRHRSSWPKLSAISAVSRRGRLYLMLADRSIRSREVVLFLKHLKRHFRHGVIMLWDRGTIHRSKITQEFVRQSRKWLDAEFLPPYAPDLNPDEWLWNHLKYRKLANFCPNTIGDLKGAIRRSVIQIRKKPGLVRSFFHASQLSRN